MDGFGDVELVHGRHDDGGCGQEKQHHKQREVDTQPLEPPANALDGEVLPADVLRIGGKSDRPLGDTELSAIGGWLGLPFTPKALALAGIEVFQYAVKKRKVVTSPVSRRHPSTAAADRKGHRTPPQSHYLIIISARKDWPAIPALERQGQEDHG